MMDRSVVVGAIRRVSDTLGRTAYIKEVAADLQVNPGTLKFFVASKIGPLFGVGWQAMCAEAGVEHRRHGGGRTRIRGCEVCSGRLRGGRKAGLCQACYLARVTEATIVPDAEIATLWHSGLTMKEIADGIGLSRERVRQRLGRVGIKGTQRNGMVRREMAVADDRNDHRRRVGILAEQREMRRAERRMRVGRILIDLTEELGRKPTGMELAARLGLGTTPRLIGFWPRSKALGSKAALREIYGLAGQVPYAPGRAPGNFGLRPPTCAPVE